MLGALQGTRADGNTRRVAEAEDAQMERQDSPERGRGHQNEEGWRAAGSCGLWGKYGWARRAGVRGWRLVVLTSVGLQATHTECSAWDPSYGSLQSLFTMHIFLISLNFLTGVQSPRRKAQAYWTGWVRLVRLVTWLQRLMQPECSLAHSRRPNTPAVCLVGACICRQPASSILLLRAYDRDI